MDYKAFKDLKSDKIKAKNGNDIKELIKICNCLGKKYLQNQRYDEAIDEHKEELKYSLDLKCGLSEAVARRALGECYSETNQYSKALSEHKKYLYLAQSLDDKIETQRAYATIGRTHLIRAQELYNNNNEVNKQILFDAKKSFTKSLQLCQNLTKEKLRDKELAEMSSRLYLNLGLVCELLGQFEEAMKRLHFSINLNERFHLTEDLFRSQISLASVYEKNNNLEMASNTYILAIKTAKLLKNKIFWCDALINNAMVLMRLRKFKDSRNQLKRAYKLNSPILEDHQKAERLLKISSIIFDDFKQLLKSSDFEEKIKLCDKLGDHFVELKLFNIAIDYYKKELNYSIQCEKSDSEIAPIYVSIAQTYADDLQFEKSVEYFQHELNCNRGNPIEETKSLIKIAEMKEYSNKEELNEEIIALYEKALKLIGNLDKNVLIDLLQRYVAFIESRRLYSDETTELKQRLKTLNDKNEKGVADDDEEQDIYDDYDLNDISEVSTDSDDEEMLNSKRIGKRMGKKIKRNQLGETLLHTACIEGKLKLVERLLADKHPVNVRDNCGWTPLHEAVNKGHKQIVELLLEKGADINDNGGQQTDGITPLHDACSNGHFEVIRLLLKKGAKVTLLNNSNETALESLRDWKRRCTEEGSLDKQNLQEFNQIERQLEHILKKEGFIRKNVPILKSLIRKTKVHLPVIRGRDSESEASDDSLDIPVFRVKSNRLNAHNFKNKNNDRKDFDDPKTARREYCASISNLRRNDLSGSRDKNQIIRPKPKVIPALLDQRSVVDSDQWLIEDLNDTRKRSCLDAYDAFNKRSKISSNTSRRPPKPKQRLAQNRIQEESSDEVMSSDNERDSGIQLNDTNADKDISQPILLSDRNEKNKEIDNSKQMNKNSETDSRNNIKPIPLRVSVTDSHNTLLIVPVLDKWAKCSWLNTEIEKRYFAKFNVKPIISLETTDGALLSDEDCILDVINSDELKVMAKIQSWVLDPLDVQYRDFCHSCGVQPIPDIIKELQFTQINGCLNLSNVNLPEQQIKPIFKSLERHNLRQIDISCSNIIFDDPTHFLNCLPFLPSLQILNLKCTALNLEIMDLLITKNCHNLRELDLSFNSFGDYFSEVIIKVIKHFPKLNSIDLSASDLTQSLINLEEFKECIKKSNLREVILDYNSIDSELIERFRKL